MRGEGAISEATWLRAEGEGEGEGSPAGVRTRWSKAGASSGCIRSTESEMPAASRRLTAASALAFSSAVENIALALMASASALAAPSWPRSLAVNCGGVASVGSRLSRCSAA